MKLPVNMLKQKDIAFIAYPVTDIERSRLFYGEKLGLKETGIFKIGGGHLWVEYAVGTSTFAITDGWNPAKSFYGSFKSPDTPGLLLRIIHKIMGYELPIPPEADYRAYGAIVAIEVENFDDAMNYLHKFGIIPSHEDALAIESKTEKIQFLVEGEHGLEDVFKKKTETKNRIFTHIYDPDYNLVIIHQRK
jgi:catechol 2,3-dioxygenase-like lactoylglutathione lyase family enzyme